MRRVYVRRMLDTHAIATRREALGLTMNDAAAAAGFKSRQHWYAIEAGEKGNKLGLTLSTLNAIAKALHCDVKDLLK